MTGFLHFMRTQGVVGLAVGFILGTASQQLVSSFSTDILTPMIGLATGRFGNLAAASSVIGGQTFGWGHFLSAFINLVLVAFVVYIAVSILHTNRLDEPKK